MAERYGAIRPAEAGDAERIAALLDEAFAVPPAPGTDAADLDLRGRWVLDGADHLDATAWAMDVPQWMNGQVVASRAVAGVAVASDRRGVGAGRAVMTQLIERAASTGAAVMTLYPSTIGFYRSLGFDVAGLHLTTRVNVADLPVLKSTAIEVVDKPDLEPLAAMYDAAARDFAGPLARPDWWWDARVFDRSHPGRRWTVVVRDGAEVAGYAVLSKARPETPKPYLHDLTVHDAGWRSPDAARELLGYLRGFVALGEWVRWPSPPGDHWLHLLTGRGPVPDVTTAPWMLRILDVPAALSGRGWPAGSAGQCVIEVRDDVVHGNQGRWEMTIADRAATVAPATTTPDLVVAVTSLAAAYTGWRSISDLVRHGLAEVTDSSRLATYDAWFAARPWLGERF